MMRENSPVIVIVWLNKSLGLVSCQERFPERRLRLSLLPGGGIAGLCLLLLLSGASTFTAFKQIYFSATGAADGDTRGLVYEE